MFPVFVGGVDRSWSRSRAYDAGRALSAGPLPTGRQMQTQTIAEAKELLSFSLQIQAGLRAAQERLPAPGHDEEQSWLAAAGRRIRVRADELEAALADAIALPEFESERQARARAQFEAWVDAAEGLLIGLSTHASPQSPLIEVLFPHQKFERVRRGGATARAFMLEIEKRRHTAYIVRLSGEPEYAFLPPLLEQLDGAKRELERREEPIQASDEQLAALRGAVYARADALRTALARARLLAEAALLEHPGWLTEIGLDAKPRSKRPSRAPAPSEP